AARQHAADHAHYLTYTGSTEQAAGSGVHYLTYTGSTEQAPDSVVRYLTNTGFTEQGADINAANQAAELRGKALNRAYGNGWTKMSSQQFTALVNMFGPDVTQYSPKQLHALLTQGSASSGGGFG